MGALKALSAEWLTSRALQRAGLAELAGAEGLGKEQPLAGTAAELTQAAELVIGAAAVKSALAPLTDGPATARPTVPREPLPLPQPAAGARVRDVMEGSRAMLKAAVAPEWCAGSRAADATGRGGVRVGAGGPRPRRVGRVGRGQRGGAVGAGRSGAQSCAARRGDQAQPGRKARQAERGG
ncbi:hypothetical protein T492DRAFT_460425 [Pavlovales sp. CCMP2436]|nr:hypothetical protein T492DRAFT_460425 [Pavlovales sp. CCMP2436]